ncbi:hypothetical protein DFH08DRAFT_1050553 [Mycena albidolilacea]|uniref:Uncharacterized protein n=1 Tax=Mycena albidolilacea TaxID=1033008 RepID=A0AAD6Z5I9_9AGAR|nr:hypothetical protein DFH08DRAFT_1050553 [Mycena albidolilacea]
MSADQYLHVIISTHHNRGLDGMVLACSSHLRTQCPSTFLTMGNIHTASKPIYVAKVVGEPPQYMRKDILQYACGADACQCRGVEGLESSGERWCTYIEAGVVVVEVKERWAKYLAMVRLYAHVWNSKDGDPASGFRVSPQRIFQGTRITVPLKFGKDLVEVSRAHATGADRWVEGWEEREEWVWAFEGLAWPTPQISQAELDHQQAWPDQYQALPVLQRQRSRPDQPPYPEQPVLQWQPSQPDLPYQAHPQAPDRQPSLQRQPSRPDQQQQPY